MNHKGTTLAELVVYLTLLVVISLLVGKQFKAMMVNYTGNKRITRQQSDSRDICALIAREIRNTGFKAYLRKNAGTFSIKTVTGTYVDNASDSSSFFHGNGDPGDTLTIFKAHIDKTGALENGIDSIRYFLDGSNLVRANASARAVVAENVYAMQFQYGISATNEVLLDQSQVNVNNWVVSNSTGTAPVLTSSGNSMQLSFQGSAAGQLKCTVPFALVTNQRLLVLVRIVPQPGFPANLDSLSFSLKTPAGVVLGSERFIPWDNNIRLTVAVQSAKSAVAVLDYNASGSGKLLINGIKVLRTDLGSYTWTDNPEVRQKRYVRAIRVFILTRSKEKTGASDESTITIADVTVKRPANYTWRVFTETVEVRNNGLFN